MNTNTNTNINTNWTNIPVNVIENMRKHVQKEHDVTRKSPMRFGSFSHPGKHIVSRSEGCFYAMGLLLHDLSSFAYSVFHGDGPVFSFKELVNPNARNNALMRYTRGFTTFEGTERTKKWVSYLLSDNSPWKDLTPFILQDIDFINNGGFIYILNDNTPRRLLYNFLLASRYPWDCPVNYGTWLLLLERGLDEALSLFISMNFELTQDAKNIEGPWSIMYPWGPLEGTSLEATYRFTNCKPRTFKDIQIFPNTTSLWSCFEHDESSEEIANNIANKGNISLGEIVHTLHEISKEQKYLTDQERT